MPEAMEAQRKQPWSHLPVRRCTLTSRETVPLVAVVSSTSRVSPRKTHFFSTAFSAFPPVQTLAERSGCSGWLGLAVSAWKEQQALWGSDLQPLCKPGWENCGYTTSLCLSGHLLSSVFQTVIWASQPYYSFQQGLSLFVFFSTHTHTRTKIVFAFLNTYFI